MGFADLGFLVNFCEFVMGFVEIFVGFLFYYYYYYFLYLGRIADEVGAVVGEHSVRDFGSGGGLWDHLLGLPLDRI